jgi:hypothetical protein
MPREAVTHLAFYIELPFALPAHARVILRSNDDDTVFSGWEDFDWGAYLDAENPGPGQIRPSTWLRFADGNFVQSAPLALAASAYPLLSETLPEMAETLAGQQRTVVELMRFVRTPVEEGEAWHESELTAGVAHLNAYLTGLALARASAIIRPVNDADLPFVIATLQGDVSAIATGRERLRYTNLFNRHRRVENEEAATPLTREQIHFAHSVSAMLGPLGGSADFVIRARAGVNEERYRHAVLDAATGVELLVSDSLTAAQSGGLLSARTSQTLTRLQAGHHYASTVREVFAPLWFFDPDPAHSDDELGEWWRRGYRLRNRVGHAGDDPSAAEAAHAAGTAGSLVIATWRRLQRRQTAGPL